MTTQNLSKIKIDQSIPANHQKCIIKKPGKILDPADTPGRTYWLSHRIAILKIALKRVTNLDPPSATVAKIVLDGMCEMTDIDHNLIEAVSGQLLHQVLHNRFAQNRDHWFGHLVRQWPDPGTLTGSKNHCLHKLNR